MHRNAFLRTISILLVAGATFAVMASCGGGGGREGGRDPSPCLPPDCIPIIGDNRAPVIAQRFEDIRLVLEIGRPFRWISPQEADAYFSDPDGDILTYDVSTSDIDVASAALGTPPNVLVQAEGGGTATITVTATDPHGRTAGQQFRVTVDERTSPPPPADDHGDTRSGATSLALGGSSSGRIETAGDVDFFRITLTEPGTLKVYTTGSLDTVGELQDGSGRRIGGNDDGPQGANFSIEHENASLGTYYVSVNGYASSTGPYTVHAELRRSMRPTNRPPQVVTRIRDDAELANANQSWTVTYRSPYPLDTYFSDPDGDPLTYSVSGDNPLFPMVVTPFEGGRVLFMLASGNGREGNQVATFTVTATDPSGATVTQSFQFHLTFFITEQPPPPPPSPTAVFNITDSCDDGSAIHYRFFQYDRWVSSNTVAGGRPSRVWPSSTQVYVTRGLGRTHEHRLPCTAGKGVCYGGNPGNNPSASYWGAGIDGDKSCSGSRACCVRCPTSGSATLSGGRLACPR